MIDIRLVCAWLINKGIQTGRPLTNLSLQKLLYFAQGFHLAENNGVPLFRDVIYAWKLGPVVKPVYHLVKKFGPLEMSKERVDELLGSAFLNTSDSLPQETKDFLESIWEVFGEYTSFELVDLTHVHGSPWYEIFINSPGNEIAPNTSIHLESMETYFNNFLQ